MFPMDASQGTTVKVETPKGGREGRCSKSNFQRGAFRFFGSPGTRETANGISVSENFLWDNFGASHGTTVEVETLRGVH